MENGNKNKIYINKNMRYLKWLGLKIRKYGLVNMKLTEGSKVKSESRKLLVIYLKSLSKLIAEQWPGGILKGQR